MTAYAVDTDLACAAADLQHAIHLVGVASRCDSDLARVDVLAEAQTLIHCAAERMVPPAVPDPDPEPADVVTIAARDLRIGDRFYLMPQRFVVRGIERADDHVDLILEETPYGLASPEAPHFGVKERWLNARPVHVLTPRPGDNVVAS